MSLTVLTGNFYMARRSRSRNKNIRYSPSVVAPVATTTRSVFTSPLTRPVRWTNITLPTTISRTKRGLTDGVFQSRHHNRGILQRRLSRYPRLTVCERRAERRGVLFAKGHNGINNSSKRLLSNTSRISCKRR